MRNWTKLYFQYGHHGGHIWNRILKLNANFGVLIGGKIFIKFQIILFSSFFREVVYIISLKNWAWSNFQGYNKVKFQNFEKKLSNMFLV